MIKISVTSLFYNLFYSFLNTALYGAVFFSQSKTYNLPSWFAGIEFIYIWTTFFILFSLLFANRFRKPVAAILFLLNAAASYFTFTYHAAIDKIMFLNLLQTNRNEAFELLNLHMIGFFTLFGILPAVIVCLPKIKDTPFKQQAAAILGSLALCGGLALASQKESIVFAKNYRHLKNYLPPINYVDAAVSILKIKLKPLPPMQSISEGITQVTIKNKPNLIVFILGETTRAANFSLNGYERPTNEPLLPYLENINYYPDTQACGTSTSISVPCIFSKDSRLQYRRGSEQYTQNILDIFNQAGYRVLWRDNDGGCKDVCRRVIYEEPCEKSTCTDDILLQGLPQKLTNNKNNRLVILHTRGSHGPSYHEHYKKQHERYTPVCTKNSLWTCSQEELRNVYDNTVFAVSDFIAETIKMMQTLQDKYNLMLIYTSDHGESLGENGIYLHAAPYANAPKEQTEVPMLVWLPSPTDYDLSSQCLPQKGAEFSHDNIFHTLLGLVAPDSLHYNKKLDLFDSCR